MKRNNVRHICTILSVGLFSTYTAFLFILIMEPTGCSINSKYDYMPKSERRPSASDPKTANRGLTLSNKPVRAAVQMDSSKAVSLQVVSYDNEEIGQNCEEFDSCNDRLGFEAIRALHRQLDDDANGNVDISESDEFLRDELQYENGYERQKGFHGNDKHISVDELWRSWKLSEVHNWTVDEAIEWLIQSVELPQYASAFQENSVDGTALPRIALNNMQFLSNILGIKDPIHKQKISLKAMDIVLFGVPRHHNYKKDILLMLSLLIAVSGCWFAYIQHKSGQAHLKKMLRDMDSLQKAEEALQVLQYELDKARQEQMSVAMEKRNLERRLEDESKTELLQVVRCPSLPEDDDHKSLNHLEEEIQYLKDELRRTEACSWKPPPPLQHWLQLTHELELKHYNAKKAASEKQLAEAKEGCDKVRKKRSSFLGTFRIAHGSVIDDVDSWILQARTAVSEITNDLQERLHRWKQIEQLCGFPVVHNAGLAHLEALLHRSSVSNGTTIVHSFSSGSVVSISPPSCLEYSEQSVASTAYPAKISPSQSSESHLDCSLHQSEEFATDDEQEQDVFKESEQNKNRPSFEIGESQLPDGLSRNSPRGQMFKSYSHDHQSPPREVVSLSRSESSLECSNRNSSLGRRIKSGHLLGSLETDATSNASLQDDDIHKEKKNRSFLKKLKKKKPKVL